MKHLLALILLLFSGFAHAAITQDAETNSADDTSGTDTTVAHTTGSCSGRKMILSLTSRGAGLHTDATAAYNGDALTRVASANQLTDSSVWYLDDPDTGTNNLVVTWNTTIANWAKLTITTICGAAAGAPEDSDTATVNGGTVLSVGVTATAGAWVFSAASHGDLGPFADRGSLTAGFNLAVVADVAGTGRFENVSAGTSTPTWTTTNSGSGALAVLSVAAAAAGASPVPVILHLHQQMNQ